MGSSVFKTVLPKKRATNTSKGKNKRASIVIGETRFKPEGEEKSRNPRIEKAGGRRCNHSRKRHTTRLGRVITSQSAEDGNAKGGGKCVRISRGFTCARKGVIEEGRTGKKEDVIPQEVSTSLKRVTSHKL